MSLRNSILPKTTTLQNRWYNGGIGVIRASIGHPLVHLLKDDPFCQSDHLSQRVQSVSNTLSTAGKFRPCLVVTKRKVRRIFLMGTLEGKSPLAIDKLTQEFLMPIAPTFRKGAFQLTVNPTGLATPSWIVGVPSTLGFDNLLGYWTNDGPGNLTYRVAPQDVDEFLAHCTQKKYDFLQLSESNPEYKTDLVNQFLDCLEELYGNAPHHRNDDGSKSSTGSGRIPKLQSIVDFPPL
ncbi:hypothetical protein BDN72DRAFT_839401 [Pluteus cervinus]|uniref:Uncharacterized protein n=1 Tax=Pluteus cervinus TaxID=181527 RepID=A0ACD3AX47_9AGAR|nr:hypothetical protein BDN72DRAFT_839401 [Pluteus cervinus]